MRQDGQEVPRRRGNSGYRHRGPARKQHLRNEQTLRTRRIAQGRQEECSPDRKQRFPPEAENRHSQQKHRIGHLVRKSRRLGEEQGGACGKSRVVRANMREVRCIVSGKSFQEKAARQKTGRRLRFLSVTTGHARTWAPHWRSNCAVRFCMARSMAFSSSVRVLSSRIKLRA